MNGFIDHLYTRLVITSNYSATANLHNSQIITARDKPIPACSVFTSLSLATASNSGHSSASRAQVLFSHPPVQFSTNNWLNPLLLTSWDGPHRNTPFPTVILLLCKYSLLRECVYRAVAQKRSLFTEPQLSNGFIRHNTHTFVASMCVFFQSIWYIYWKVLGWGVAHKLVAFPWCVNPGDSSGGDDRSPSRDINHCAWIIYRRVQSGPVKLDTALIALMLWDLHKRNMQALGIAYSYLIDMMRSFMTCTLHQV
jgi:hypothetical protein